MGTQTSDELWKFWCIRDFEPHHIEFVHENKYKRFHIGSGQKFMKQAKVRRHQAEDLHEGQNIEREDQI